MGRFSDGLLSRRSGNPKAEMPFLEHLEELRWRILWSILAVVIGALAGFLAVHYLNVIDLLLEPGRELFSREEFGGEEWRPINLAPTDPFFIFLKVSLSIGVILAFPVIAYQVWSFLSPALEKHEKRAIVPALYLGLVLFTAGVAMSYFIALPISLRFLTGILSESMTPGWTATAYMGFVVKLLLAFGIVFELPVVVLILSALGLITPEFLRSKRRHAIVVNLIVAAALSPGDVLVVTALMMVPLILLYELSIGLSVIMWRGRRSREAATTHEVPPEPVAPPDGTVPDGLASSAEEVPDSASPYTHGDPAQRADDD